jgi:DNA-binding CsgD family transcriptional regulator
MERLSDRELEVFRLIGEGRGTREIAESLHLSIKTIETYRAHIKEKLSIRSAAELARAAVNWVESARHPG